MATPDITIDVDLSALKEYEERVDAELNHQRSGPVAKAMKQWAVRYRSFAQERFDKASKGGGGWPPLSPATLRRRRKGKKAGRNRAGGNVAGRNKAGRLVDSRGRFVRAVKASILRDMGILFAVLSPTFSGKPGQLEQNIPYGIRVGFGGPHKHASGGSATIADIASFHNNGEGFLPKREIIVEPTANVTAAMATDMERALKKLGDEIK